MNRIVAILLGSILALVGLASALFGLLVAFGNGKDADRFVAGTMAIPFGLMLAGLGLATAWLTVRARRNDGERSATLPPWWASALAFAVAVGGGWLALRFDQWWAFFPLATVAVFVPIVAAGRLGLPSKGWRPGWPRLLAAFAWGALVTPILAIVGQLAVIIGLMVAGFFGLALGGQENFQLISDTWTYHLQGRDLNETQVAALVQFLLRQPLVLLLGASILVFAAPATEELFKFAAAPLFGRTRPRPGGAAADPPLTFFLIGLASGLGFAATENILYVGQAGEAGWTVMALVRGVTPLMHGTATALFALGLARQAQHPRGWALLRGALAALGLHGAWNLCAGLLLVASAFATGPDIPVQAIVLLLLSLMVLGSLLLLCVGILLRQRNSLAVTTAPETLPPGGPGTPALPQPVSPPAYVPPPPPPPFATPVRAGSE